MSGLPSFVIGSRGSALALWQAEYISDKLKALGARPSIRVIRTTGDHLQTALLAQAGGKGLFTRELDEALLAGEIDLAVHSLKDLPTELPPGLLLAAIPERSNAQDALVGCSLHQLPVGARVGTSSLRRAAQILHMRPDLRVLPIRGNVDTRIRRLDEGAFEAILLAAAGLERLGLGSRIAHLLTITEMCPAPGQGALALATRAETSAEQWCSQLDHPATRSAVECERAVLAALGGGCQLPVGVFAQEGSGALHVRAVVISPDGRQRLAVSASGRIDRAERLARALAEDLTQRGAADLLAMTAPSAIA